ncbi:MULTISPECIES: hypothetical protein [Burkholderiaceae]|uniref:hypothetical protein n=1 Tax=Burkholderiaceae TaxID=119060 RepID=UPI000967B238|nr:MULTISPECIES: hypothetical protein [Burkholderiaceae]MCF2135310.1 hypothetical protein [Mycetohabitans sp. B3]MCG1019718.1 hypothetical protein [Mycetohabitans sp. B4]MCG1040862.1 hypothetical protein [Mycetohabitans sp. B7]SIT65225.1 hypothetical protein SAMN04487769_0527 [Burkholderia sp. b14]SIT78984.1 hypothetical protein SAMN04487768_0134 [Burkholderia sp. b13]
MHGDLPEVASDVRSADAKRMLEVETQHGQTKTWAKLLAFYPGKLPTLRDAIVKIGAWTFSIQTRA